MKNAVRNLAYSLWEQAGRPEGRDQEFWLEAERLLVKPNRETKGKLAPRGAKPETVKKGTKVTGVPKASAEQGAAKASAAPLKSVTQTPAKKKKT